MNDKQNESAALTSKNQSILEWLRDISHDPAYTVTWRQKHNEAADEIERLRALINTPHTHDFIDVVFDGPPSHESGRFVEVEDPAGKSISVGQWIDRGNGLWALRISRPGGIPPLEPSGEPRREQYEAGEYGTQCFKEALAAWRSEKSTEKRCVLRPDMPCPATDDNPYCQCPAPEAL